jgi:hypothetical protein
MTATSPERLAQLTGQFRSGKLDEIEFLELRSALNARTGRPPLETEDILQDLKTLLAATPASPSPASAPAPALKPAATSGNDSSLLARYEAVQNDPQALANFLQTHQAEVHAFLNRADSAAFVERQRRAVASGVKTTSDEDLLAQYQAVQNDPVKLANFLQSNDAKIRALLDRPAAA